jgi:hypothetical protein
LKIVCALYKAFCVMPLWKSCAFPRIYSILFLIQFHYTICDLFGRCYGSTITRFQSITCHCRKHISENFKKKLRFLVFSKNLIRKKHLPAPTLYNGLEKGSHLGMASAIEPAMNGGQSDGLVSNETAYAKSN